MALIACMARQLYTTFVLMLLCLVAVHRRYGDAGAVTTMAASVYVSRVRRAILRRFIVQRRCQATAALRWAPLRRAHRCIVLAARISVAICCVVWRGALSPLLLCQAVFSACVVATGALC